MAARTFRLELRADPERERRIRFAADLSHQSVSTSHAGDDLVVAYFSLAALSRSSTDRP